ncbi:unnamed protein product [Closterium sp. NIES-64]|nr:unnamed protein product [Closterium sp. NIES-64]
MAGRASRRRAEVTKFLVVREFDLALCTCQLCRSLCQLMCNIPFPFLPFPPHTDRQRVEAQCGSDRVLVEREFDLASEVINFLHLCGFTTAVHSILTGSLCPCFSLVLPTIRRSVEVTKFLVEREFDLALEVINFLHLPAVQIYPPADVSLLAILRPTPTGGVWKWQSSGGFALEVINFLHLLAVRIYASVAALLAEKGPLDWIKYILTPADMDDARNAV